MSSRARLAALSLGTVLSLGLVVAPTGSVSAATGPQISPRAGSYSGLETAKPNPVPVSFSVSKNHKRVVSFSGEAEARAGCKNHITGFEAPTAPMLIGRAGRFARSSTSYPQPGVRVTVTGRFTTRTKVRGHITIRFARVKGCNASRLFTAAKA